MMDDSTPPAPLATTPQAQMCTLPTEIVENVLVCLMEGFPVGLRALRERSIKFTHFGAVSRCFRALSKRNGYYYADTSEQLCKLVGLLGDEQTVAGMKCLTLQGQSGKDCLSMRKILLAARSAPKLKQLSLVFVPYKHSAKLQYHRRRGLVMDALEGLKNIEMFDGDWIGFPNETALCRALSQWVKVRTLRLLEASDSSGQDEIDDDQPNFPSCLAQLSSTSLPRLTDLTIGVETLARVELVERILSFGRVTDLDIDITLNDVLELDRIELAVRKAAGRLKKFGTLTPHLRPSFILSLYPLLSSCDTLSIEFSPNQTIHLPSPTQLPFLRTLSVYPIAEEHLELLGTFVLDRKTPLDTLEIHGDDMDFDALEEICDSVGTRLVRM